MPLTDLETAACKIRLQGVRRKIKAREGHPNYVGSLADAKAEELRLAELLRASGL